MLVQKFRRRVDPDPYHVLFVFDVPEDAVVHTKHMSMAGKYSQIDDIWKLKILEFHGFDIDGHTGKILFQSDSLKRELEEDAGCNSSLPGRAAQQTQPERTRYLILNTIDPSKCIMNDQNKRTAWGLVAGPQANL